ncbi:hypothetical protein Q604_UNBC13048G0001, partial [human gut metagenome]
TTIRMDIQGMPSVMDWFVNIDDLRQAYGPILVLVVEHQIQGRKDLLLQS